MSPHFEQKRLRRSPFRIQRKFVYLRQFPLKRDRSRRREHITGEHEQNTEQSKAKTGAGGLLKAVTPSLAAL
jgi:hypothetical protein